MITEKEKNQLLENLRKVPIVQIACDRTGVGRTTFYRWKKEDKEFAEELEKAIEEGIQFINDLSESQLISQIKAGKLPAITLWLKHNNPRYNTDRVEISGSFKTDEKISETLDNIKKMLDNHG